MTIFKNTNCDKTQTQMVRKKNQIMTKPMKSKTQIVTKLNNIIVRTLQIVPQLKSCYKTQKLKFRQKKTQTGTYLKKLKL